MEASGLEAQVLEVLARLETDGASGRDLDFLAGARVAADAALARLDLEHAEAAQLDPVPPHQGVFHGLEHGLDGHFRLDLRDVGGLRDLVDDVHLDHDGMELLLSDSYYRVSRFRVSNLS